MHIMTDIWYEKHMKSGLGGLLKLSLHDTIYFKRNKSMNRAKKLVCNSSLASPNREGRHDLKVAVYHRHIYLNDNK